MKTWEEIEEALAEAIPAEHIKPRDTRKGIYGEWIKGQTAMEFANQVFGAGNWESSVVSGPHLERVSTAVQKSTGEMREGLIVTVVCSVTAWGLNGDKQPHSITKTDVGFGDAEQSFQKAKQNQAGGYVPLKPAQIQAAYMGAVTIGIKRCLHQFGRRLGMELYLSEEHWESLGWEDIPEEERGTTANAKARRSARQQRPAAQRPEPSGNGQTKARVTSTNAKLAAELGIEETDENREQLTDLWGKRQKRDKAGATVIGTKQIKLELKGPQKIEAAYALMGGYMVWVASEAEKDPSPSTPFQNAHAYDILHRQCQDLEYELRGGTFEPWPNAGIHDPEAMVGWGLESAVLKKMRSDLIERFPHESGDEVNRAYLKQHLNNHFQRDRIGAMTWEQLSAFRAHVQDGIEYPEKFGPVRAEEAEPVQEEIDFGGAVSGGPETTEIEAEAEAQEPEAESSSVPPDDSVTGVDQSDALPEDAADYTAGSEALLAEIGEQIESTKDLIDWATEEIQVDLGNADIHRQIQGIHKALANGNVSGKEMVMVILETALRGRKK